MTIESAAGGPAGEDVVLEVTGVSKAFPGTMALLDVSLAVRRGEIHGLVGGNGCGKSTLIKVLTGVYRGEPGGHVRINDRTLDASAITPDIARGAGIGVVHQDLAVFPRLSVAENLSIGRSYPRGRGGRVDWPAVRRRAADLIERFDIPARPETPLQRLSQAARTQVAIARALGVGSGGGLLILDEPTAALPEQEVSSLLSRLRRYADQGHGIILVTHHLNEVLESTDRVSVLRDGRNVGTYDTTSLDEERLVELIVGRSVGPVSERKRSTRTRGDAVALDVSNLSAGAARDVSFQLDRGEILGVAGLLGSGRTSILRAIFADVPVRSGDVSVDGDRTAFAQPSDAIGAGIAYIPEGRLTDAVFADLPVAMNISAVDIRTYWRRGRIASRAMRRDGTELMDRFAVKASSSAALMSTLSGGNQQKVIIGRWMRRDPRLLLLDEPTQGVDVGARADIHRLIRDAVAGGAAALVVASDVEELAQLCDRVIVLHRGRVVGEIDGDDLTPEHVLSSLTRTEVPA